MTMNCNLVQQARYFRFPFKPFRRTFSYLHTPQSKPWITYTLGERIQQHVAKHPDKNAFIYRSPSAPRIARTWSQFEKNTAKLASVFINDGFKFGDRALLYAPSNIQYMESNVALSRAGLSPIRHAQSMVDLESIGEVLKKHKCSTLLFDPGENGETLAEAQKHLSHLFKNTAKNGDVKMAEYPHLRKIYLTQSCDLLEASTVDLADNADRNYRDVIRKRERSADLEDVCCVIQTSGSTGRPKAIPFSHFNLMNNAIHLCDVLGINENSVYFNDRAFSWIGCFSPIPFSSGCTYVIVPTSSTLVEQNVDFVKEVLTAEKCTNGLLMKYILVDLLPELESGQLKLPNLKTILTGGEIIENTLLQKVRKFIPRVLNIYGLTETNVNTFIEITPERHPQSVGTLLPGTEAKIIDEEGRTVPVGTTGEICIRCPTNLTGYMDNEELTKAQLTPEGYWKTTDMGYIQNNQLHIIARKSDLISFATRKVPPAYIENMVQKHDAVEMTCAIGLPDPRVGEIICACVVLKKNCDVTESEILDFCLGSAKDNQSGTEIVPHKVIFVDEIPKTRTGKIARKVLKESILETINK